jgi:crotonobetainyl-CoA:carnitine CoA-transferase CaiB-like acyl-CoA transferase
VIYVSLSGFGDTPGSEYASWPAYASIVEAMSGIYDYNCPPGQSPRANPVGAMGDISSALFGAVGVLAALRHRDITGEGQRVDIAMYDAAIAMTDVVMNFWSLGIAHMGGYLAGILDTFRAADGWFVMQIVRDHQFHALADLVGRPQWKTDPRFAERTGWNDNLEAEIRPAVEEWARAKPKRDVVKALTSAGVVSGPCHTATDLVNDPHVARRAMLVELPRTDGVDQPVLIPGNPVKLSKMADGPEARVPWVGEHTAAVLRDELGLTERELADLRAAGAIT